MLLFFCPFPRLPHLLAEKSQTFWGEKQCVTPVFCPSVSNCKTILRGILLSIPTSTTASKYLHKVRWPQHTGTPTESTQYTAASVKAQANIQLLLRPIKLPMIQESFRYRSSTASCFEIIPWKTMFLDNMLFTPPQAKEVHWNRRRKGNRSFQGRELGVFRESPLE